MLKLDSVADGDIHTLADFAELLCMLKPDRTLSLDDLDDHLVDECEKSRGELPLGDAFAHLGWRESAFSAAYPFSVAPNQRSISAPDQLSPAQTVYAFVLLCANLPTVRSPVNPLTDAFERLAHVALRRMWPSSASVLTFGKNTTQYQGSKAQRLQSLAHNIGGRPSIDPARFRPRDSGDGGIDLVAWLELDPFEGENKPAGLAQCACSRSDWSGKQFEVSRGSLGKLICPTAPWLEMLFIPTCFRNNTGRWAVDAEVGEIVMIDRLRLLQFIDAVVDLPIVGPPEVFERFLDARIEAD